jgi:anti-sigma-K factor RskA
MNDRDDGQVDLLVAEYVLGTLHGQARRRFERQLADSSTLRDAVSEWERRLGKLALLAPPETPPEASWRGIEQRLFKPEPAMPWYQRLGPWRGLALASSLCAMVLAGLLVVSAPGERSPDYAGMLISALSREPVWAASTDASMEHLMVKNNKVMTLPPGRGCILWLEVASGERYVIGQLPDDGSEKAFTLTPELRDRLLDSRLVVTVEDISSGLPQTSAGRDYYYGRMVPLRSS